MAGFRAKKYANKDGKAKGVLNKLQVAGDIELFEKLAKGDKTVTEEFNKAVKDALK